MSLHGTITTRQSQQEEESVVARNTDGSIELRFSQVRFHPGDQVGNKPGDQVAN